jgi:predicted ATPase
MAILLATALAKAGRFALALNTIDTALEGFDGSPLAWDAELAREKGELLMATGANPEEIERCFRSALDAARRQNAKSLELRAALSLSRFQAEQGHESEGRQLLAGIYGWFTEGIDTADLKHARAVLEPLS